MGGFGISRYKIDAALAVLARTAGVDLFEGARVTDIRFEKQVFTVITSAGEFEAKVACGTFGKRSNLDVRWDRSFTRKKSERIEQLCGRLEEYHVTPEICTEAGWDPGGHIFSQVDIAGYQRSRMSVIVCII